MAWVSSLSPPFAERALNDMRFNSDNLFRSESEDILRVLEAPHFENEEDFYYYLNNQNGIRNDDGVSVAESCTNSIFQDDGEKLWFPPYKNTNPIISAHTKVWRAGRTNNILALVIGTKEEAKSYLVGLLVTPITILICFLAWMILLITLKGLGRNKVGYLSGRRAKLPPRPVEALIDSKVEAETKTTPDSAVEEAPQAPDQEGNDGGINDINENSNSDSIESNPISSVADQKEKKPKEPVLLTNDEWNELYATKKKEERWMSSAVLVACIIVICMAGVMASKGVESLRQSLSDGKESISYAQTLLNGTEGVVNNLANGLGDLQSDVLDLLERANTEICPEFKPEGICVPYLKTGNCDFTIQIDMEKDITLDRLDVNKTIGVSYEYTIDGSELKDSVKDKIGLDGRLDIRELLFPSSNLVYEKMIDVFSANWSFVDKIHNFADTIGSVSSIAAQAEEQIDTINWLFYVAVAFDVIVGLLALGMIVHILASDKLPHSFKCIQRRCLFPLFIACVSIAFIFAIAFLVASMALSDTCYDDPSERVLLLAEHYMGNGLAADYATDLVKHWVSQCDIEPKSMQEDQAFYDRALVMLEEFEAAMQNVTVDAAEFCGTTDPYLFVDIISTIIKVLCSVMGLMLDIRKAFQCSTWMPLYYNTLHNAVCYNATDGLWIIAVTQCTTVLMACIILTFRAVFFDLEISVENDQNGKELDIGTSSGDQTKINEEKNFDPDREVETK